MLNKSKDKIKDADKSAKTRAKTKVYNDRESNVLSGSSCQTRPTQCDKGLPVKVAVDTNLGKNIPKPIDSNESIQPPVIGGKGKQVVKVVQNQALESFVDKFTTVFGQSLQTLTESLNKKLDQFGDKITNGQRQYDDEYEEPLGPTQWGNNNLFEEYEGTYDHATGSDYQAGSDNIIMDMDSNNNVTAYDQPPPKRARTHDLSDAGSDTHTSVQADNSVVSFDIAAGSSMLDEEPKVIEKSILESLGFKDDVRVDETGPDISQELASLVNQFVKEGIVDEKLSEKLKNHPRPKNCDTLSKVSVNKVIWDKLTSNTRSQDVKLQKVQTTIIAAISAVAKAVDKLLVMTEIDRDIIRSLVDGIGLLATANREVNFRRREHIKPELNFNYKHLCSNTLPVTTELFGDDISKQVKELTEVNQMGKRIGGRPPFQSNSGFPYNPRRGRSTYRGYRGGRGNTYENYRRPYSRRPFLGASQADRRKDKH